jgi:hypothetical protein
MFIFDFWKNLRNFNTRGILSFLGEIAKKLKISNLHSFKTAKIWKVGFGYFKVLNNIFQRNQKLQLTLADN